MRGYLLGILLGVVLLPVALLGWLWLGKVPVAVTDPPFRMSSGLPDGCSMRASTANW